MPVNFQARQNVRTNIFNRAAKSPEKEKENRPPSSHARAASALNASPKRLAQAKDSKALTPSRKAPLPPSAAGNLANLAKSPVRLQGRTLVQLQQARSHACLLASMDSDFDTDASETMGVVLGGPRLLPSPAKWDPMEHGEEMPSPFLAKKVGTKILVR